MDTVYVVYGSTGEYSDHREWPVAAFFFKTDAEAKVLRCDERARLCVAAREALDDMYSSADEAVVAAHQDEDPDMRVDYTGTRYAIWAVPFARTP